MAETDQIAAPPPQDDTPNSVMDDETRLRPEFVDKVLDAVDEGDDETARKLVRPLHPADVADLIELAARDEREGLVKALAGIISPDVLAEMNDYVREGLLDEMEPQQVADIAGQLDTDDAVALIEDLDRDEQQAVLQRMEPDDRAAVEEALGYPQESAGRLMQRELCAVPDHWNVGQVIDYVRSAEDLPDDFWEVFVVDATHHPVGTCKLSLILRTPRTTAVSDIMQREQTLIPVDMDQEDVALRFQKYALVSAAVTDESGRLVGMITVDDVVHIIQEEAGEDALLLSQAGDGDINEPLRFTIRSRMWWLFINLGTEILSVVVIGFYQDLIAKLVVLAMLMPVITGMGGNAATQTMAVTVRALATGQLTSSNSWRMILREWWIASANGWGLGLIMLAGIQLYYHDWGLSIVTLLAMILNSLNAGLSGVLIPIGLNRLKIDPAVVSTIFVTTMTDTLGFFFFLGLAAAFGLH